ncbi:diguanylate cyclase [Pseudomonadota bacterium]|nr:diguanylate cyclase [Pseudomonadota bacterium]
MSTIINALLEFYSLRMNANIKTILSYTTLAVVIVSILLAWAIFDLSKESQKLKQIERDRYLMLEKADELKQSSEDLTKYARLHANTASEQYKDIYFHILAIRNGHAEKPVPYDSLYWQLSEPIRSQKHPLYAPSSLESEMEKLPYSPSEFAKLEESEFNSNDLVKLEIEAFNAMEGLFKGDDGRYTVKGAANQQLAIELLISKQYLNEKEKIMLPMDDFLHSLTERMEKAISNQHKLIDASFQRILVFFLSGILIFVYTVFFIKRRILSPIESLTNSVTAFESGGIAPNSDVNYEDEIGVMTKRFFEMKDKLDIELLKEKELATIDSLTGIKNRRYFYEISESILKITYRTKEPLSILMLDLDYFKAINDNYGHVIGDDILIYFANKIGSKIRKSDIFARYGGEEFVVLLPNTNIDGATKIAEKIRQNVENDTFVDGEVSIAITVSIGVAEVKNEKLMRQLTQRVDGALYEAKESGRNKIVVAK